MILEYGGLTVLSEIIKELPNEDLIYVGDAKHFPYGNKSKENIIKISKKNVNYLINRNVKAIIIACGTATSQALEELQKEYSIPILGIISPTVHNVINDKTEKIGVIATKGTIKSQAWEIEIKRKNPETTVINSAAPLLAPMAEEGWTANEVAKATIKEYMKVFKNENIEKLILGCTHYPLFEKIIKQELGNNVEIVNTGKEMAKYLKKYLFDNELNNKENNIGKKELNLTDTECNFIEIGKKILNEDIQINKICIETSYHKQK